MFKKLAALCLISSSMVSISTAISTADPVTEFRVAGWNMESGDSSNKLLKQQLGEKEGIDLWGFSEVRNDDALKEFELGAEIGEGDDFARILGISGYADRLGIVYNTDALELISSEEIEPSNPNLFARHRKPLIATFKGKTTGIEFIFMVNHLARRDGGARKAQARFLNKWAADQDKPIIAVGDFNFDYHVKFGDGGDRDEAFDEFIKDGHWIWVKPDTLTKTQASDNYNSVLDFVFVANPLSNWDANSTILARDGDKPAPVGDFDDDGKQSDHRPVDSVFFAKLSDRFADRRADEQFNSDTSTEALKARMLLLQNELEEIQNLISERAE